MASGSIAPAVLLPLLLGLAACHRGPPPSQFPTARDALDRMRATYACSRGISGEGKVDYVGDEGRVRGNVMFMTSRPESVRFDAFTPFGVTLSTLTSDGARFTLLDVKAKQFLEGPASECNVARITAVPVPPHVLVPLLAGEAPVLVHDPGQARLSWQSGSYVLVVDGRHGARETITLEPRPEDWERPWAEQRVRVTDVTVEQKGVQLYRVELTRHEAARTAKSRSDEDGLDAPIPPSGPACDAEVPRGVRVEVPTSGRDVIFQFREVAHNPPLLAGAFSQPRPGGVKVRYSECR